MGIILAYHVFQKLSSASDFDTCSPLDFHDSSIGRLAMLSSAVSSKMLHAMAEKESFHHEETLTGFKWLGNRSLELVKRGYIVPFAFEEAIGYMFGDVVRDKDGIAAATVFLSLVVELYEQKKTVLQLLEQLYKKYNILRSWKKVYSRYGYFASRNSYIIVEDPTKMTKIFHNLRHEGGHGIRYIAQIGEHRIRRIKDVSLKYDSQTEGMPTDRPVSPSSEMISFELVDSTVMTLRGSGTEPKLKYYIEAKGSTMEEATSRATAVEDALKRLLDVEG
jgi:phosphoglucomutase